MKRQSTTRRAFTLVELLLVIIIIAMLGAMTIAVSRSAIEMAKKSRTEMTVARIDGIVTALYEKYQYRKVDLTAYLSNIGTNSASGTWWYQAVAGYVAADLPPAWGCNRDPDPTKTLNVTNSPAINQALFPALIRMHVIRDTIRMDMPCWPIEVYGPVRPDGRDDTLRTTTPLCILYEDALAAAETSYGTMSSDWSIGQNWQFNAELLYLIVMNGDPEARAMFSDREVADTNGNGLLEFVDGWGNPICWIRQPLGLGADERQSLDEDDPFDPLFLDGHIDNSVTPSKYSLDAFLTLPLVFSAGPDKLLGLDPGLAAFSQANAFPEQASGARNRVANRLYLLYPFQNDLNLAAGCMRQADGTVSDLESKDNIHSHKVVR